MKYIKTFENFELNEGIFTNKYDEPIKKLFDMIQKTFDYNNLYHGVCDISYRHGSVILKINNYDFYPKLEVNDKEIDCSLYLKIKINHFLKKRYKEKEKIELEKTIKEG